MPGEGRGQGWACLALAALAAAAVIGGLVLTGGPLQARKERRDTTRQGDLMAMALQAECLTQQAGGVLPEAVVATGTCPFTGRTADPFTGAAYRYEVIDARNWRLCAAFETPPESATRRGPAARDEGGCSVHHLPAPVEFRERPPEIEPERVP